MTPASNRGTSRHLEHALLLIEQGRADLAERSLREHLAAEPDDGEAVALLALTQADSGQATTALDTATAALRLVPESPTAHYALASAALANGRYGAAADAANEVIRLAPGDSLGYQALTIARSSQLRSRDALVAAEAGLRLDPTNDTLLGLHAIVLTQLGRSGEAAVSFEEALRVAPTNPLLHAGLGIRNLYDSRWDAAAESFQESLRLGPTNESARIGLVEALKARNPLYGALLAGTFAFMKLGTRGVVILVAGWLVIQYVLRGILNDPATERLGFILTLIYGFVIWLYGAAPSIFDFLLFHHPVGRDALSADEIREAKATGWLIAIAIAAAIAWLLTGTPTALFWAVIVALGLVMPLANVYSVRPGLIRRAFAAYLCVAATLGLTSIVLRAIGTATNDTQRMSTAEPLFIAAVIMIVAATWLSWPAALKT